MGVTASNLVTGNIRVKRD